MVAEGMVELKFTETSHIS